MSAQTPLANEERVISTTSPTTGIPEWLTPVLQSVTLATVIGCAFWLGSLSSTVKRTELTVDRLAESKEVTGNRLTAIETRLTAIETKLDAIDKRLYQATLAPKR